MRTTRTLKATAAGLALTAGVAGTALVLPVGIAAAQDAPTAQTAPEQPGNAPRAPRRVIVGALRTAAETIGISPRDLGRALRDGQSVADVARANGVDPQTVADALVEKGTAKVDEAVAAGRIDAERGELAKNRLHGMVTKLVNHTFQRPGGGR